MALGKNIRKRREQLGWTLEQLSDASGVEIGTISALENRDSKRSQFSTALAKALGVTVEGLESGVFEETRSCDAGHTFLPKQTTQTSAPRALSQSLDGWLLTKSEYARFAALSPEGQAWALAKFEAGIAEAETRYLDQANSA